MNEQLLDKMRKLKNDPIGRIIYEVAKSEKCPVCNKHFSEIEFIHSIVGPKGMATHRECMKNVDIEKLEKIRKQKRLVEPPFPGNAEDKEDKWII